MNRATLGLWIHKFLVSGFVSLTISALSGRADEPLPDPAEMTQRILERARAVAQTDSQPIYSYQSYSRLEALNDNDEVIRVTEKAYEVQWVAGLPVKRLVEVKGLDLSPEELAKEQGRDERFQEHFTARNTRGMASRQESVVSQELLDRFHFEVNERVLFKGRPTLVMTFVAKEDPEAGGSIQDRILNRLAGTLWVDEQEADTAKISIRMVQPLTIGWLAIFGSITQCEFEVERLRMPEGLWINQRHSLHIHLRKLVQVMHFKKTEVSTGFQKVPTASLQAVAVSELDPLEKHPSEVPHINLNGPESDSRQETPQLGEPSRKTTP